MADEIKLTHDELEELKDTIAFRTKTTIYLKTLDRKITEINGQCKKMPVIEAHQKIQYGLIIIIMTGILGLAFKVTAMALAK